MHLFSIKWSKVSHTLLSHWLMQNTSAAKKLKFNLDIQIFSFLFSLFYISFSNVYNTNLDENPHTKSTKNKHFHASKTHKTSTCFWIKSHSNKTPSTFNIQNTHTCKYSPFLNVLGVNFKLLTTQYRFKIDVEL